MTTGKTIALTKWTFIGKVMSLLFNRLSRFVIAFLPRSKRLLISWLQSPHTVVLEHNKIVCHCFHFPPFCLPWSNGILVFWMLSFKPALSLSSFILIKRLFSSSSPWAGSSVLGISQARILEWIAISSSRRSSLTQVWNPHSPVSPASAHGFFSTWVALLKDIPLLKEHCVIINRWWKIIWQNSIPVHDSVLSEQKRASLAW